LSVPHLTSDCADYFLTSLHSYKNATVLPAGLINIVNDLSDMVDVKLTTNPDVAKISFSGATVVGKSVSIPAKRTIHF
jgi:acyl-CoA reductase-like NAD-dependent aldehyde dehydrogenase